MTIGHMSDARILMGVVGRAHGVRGLVRVHSYTADPADLSAYGALRDEAGRPWSLAWRGDGVAALQGPDGPVADRTAAERLVNMQLFIARAQLPEPDEDEFYLHDLIGLRAEGPDGGVLGPVSQVHDYGAGVSIEVARQPALIVPFTRACVPVVDLAGGRIVVVPPTEIAAEFAGEAPA